jgi:amino acid adenylation domain-containing protein
MNEGNKTMSGIIATSVEFDPFAEGEIQYTIPTTESQKEIWLSVQLGGDEANCAYNESVFIEIHGDLNVEAVKKSFQKIVLRHEALRGTIGSDGSTFCIANDLTLTIPDSDFSQLTKSEKEQKLNELLRREVTHPFNLAHGPLFRVEIVKLEEHKFGIVFTGHHIVMDGWSTSIIINELNEIYSACVNGDQPSLSTAIPFGDYVKFLTNETELKRRESIENFWIDRYKDSVPVLDIPTTFNRPLHRTFQAEAQLLEIESGLVEGLKKLGAKARCSLMVTMLAGLKILLARLSKQNDLVVGIPAAGQSSTNMGQLVGHCVNTLPIRSTVNGDSTVIEYLQSLRPLMLDAYENQDFTFGSLLKKLNIQRDSGRVPLVSILFNIDQGMPNLTIGGLRASLKTNLRRYENFEWFINGTSYDGKVHLECHYNTNLFDRQTMEWRLNEFKTILRQMVENQDTPIRSLSILPTDEYELQIRQWNQTEVGYPKQKCAHTIIIEQAKANPDKTAIEFGDKTITYREMDKRSDELALYLKGLGAQPGKFIGIFMDRSIDMVIALLGVHKAGAAYVPLDPDYPVERISYMIQDAGIDILLTQSHLQAPVDHSQTRIINMDAKWNENAVIKETESHMLDVWQTPDPENLAYVLYTSGSTGKPKGVEIPHRALVNFLSTMAVKPGICPNDKLLAVTTLSFDIAGLEIFLPLTMGATVRIVRRDTAMDAGELIAEINRSKPTMMQATPSTWRMMLDEGWNGSAELKVLCGGEPFPRDLVRQLVSKCKEVWNMYGPTETTIWSTCYRFSDPDDRILIGRPIGNTQCYVLDDFKQPLPIGVPGELYIGGEGVAKGYHNRPELTSAAFSENPFTKKGIIYKTGDLVRFLADGNIEYYNRIDNQVKVRGFRIELGEIESALEGHTGISRAVARVHNFGNSDNRIIVYYTQKDATSIDQHELRTHLRGFLPEYMIPQHFIAMDNFPLTPAGKVDKKILPLPDVSGKKDSKDHVPAQSVTEKNIHEKWQKVLGIQASISIVDNFFELGGHSLLATQLIAAIKKDHRCAISLREFFEKPTIQALADLIDKNTSKVETDVQLTIQKRESSENAPLSLQQQRLWYLDKLDSQSLAYNLPGRRRIRGPLDIAVLEKCIDRIFERHEILRTRLKDVGSYAIQEIVTHTEFKLPITDLSHMKLKESEIKYEEDLMNRVQQPFDLYKAPLIRLHLYKLAEQDYILFFMPHHIIWDGWSFDVFHNELNLLYSAAIKGETAQLPELTVQYGDYAKWQMDWLQSGGLDEQLSFWKKKLGGELPVLELPTDYPRPANMSYQHGNTAFFKIERRLTDKITEDSHKSGATFFMALLAAYKILLHRFSGGQRDIIVGSPISGRNFTEANSLLGFFVNTLVLRSEIKQEASFSDFLKQVKATCLEAFNYQDTPFERIVEVLNPVRDVSRSPIFQAVFAYQDVRNRKKEFAGMSYEQINIQRPAAQTDIDYWVRLSDEGITGGFDFTHDLFKDSTMERVVVYYKEIIKRIAENPDIRIADLITLPQEEYKLQVRDWNDTAMDYPRDMCVHELFSAKAREKGQQVVIEFDNQVTSYTELDRKSDLLSRYLIKLGVKRGDLVGIHMERCAEMVVAMLGILKAGAGYVPLDPEYPVERIQYMMEDAGIKILLTQSHLNPPIKELDIRPVYLDTQWEEITSNLSDDTGYTPPTEWIPPEPENIAYVLYTSGSTGKPKGVEVPHRALVNFLTTMVKKPGISESDTLLAVTTLSFDIAGLEIFLPLVSGAKLVIANREAVMDADELLKLMQQCGVTMMQATPSTWRMLLVAGWQGDKNMKILCGGEAFPKDLARTLVSPCGEVWNMYGPTETTIWSTCYQIKDADGPILIGKPIGNTQTFILDEKMKPVPIGVPGELYLGGDGVTLGYHNRPDLTQKAFVKSPFSTEFKRPTIYKTGDLCRYQSDGNIEYLNRIDTQVKVRGFRIELGEIESRLEEHESVKQAIAIVKEISPGDVRLAAYIVPKDQREIISTEMRTHLRKNLPDYMIPQHFFETQTLPLTPAGKVDRKKLMSQFKIGSEAEEQIIAPSTENEKYLAVIWQEVTMANAISTHHNFFNIGGHSLLAMRVIARIADETGVTISPRDMLLNTLGQIAAQYQFIQDKGQSAIKPKSGGGILKNLKNKIIKQKTNIADK